jgi:hypothetical protein
MLRKGILAGACVLVAIFGPAVLRGQQPAAKPPISPEAHEFPIVLRQNVVAGVTPVGTKVQAKLVIATLVDSVVIPRDAVLSGEVTESAAKSAGEPSRLAIRMDSAQWKNGSTPIKAYLTGWYYPPEPIADPKLSYQPADAAQSPRNWNGAGTYPDANNPASQPFPGRDSNKDQSPETASPASNISKHRLLIKNVDATRHDDGAVTLTSAHANIKLDKITTYVLSGGGVPAEK